MWNSSNILGTTLTNENYVHAERLGVDFIHGMPAAICPEICSRPFYNLRI